MRNTTNILQFIPHSGAMVLIDQIADTGDDYLVTTVNLSKPGLFTDADGRVPSYVGLEYMAQTISAFIGTKAVANGQPIKLGFLLGTRQYYTQLDYFPKATIITIKAAAVIIDHEFGVFDCSIMTADNVIIASAQLKAIQPDDISALQ